MTLNKSTEYQVLLTVRDTGNTTFMMTVLSNVCKTVVAFQKDQAHVEQATINVTVDKIGVI